jgi:hypothetical protein
MTSYYGENRERNSRAKTVGRETQKKGSLELGCRNGALRGPDRPAALSYTHLRNGIPANCSTVQSGIRHYVDLPRTYYTTRSARAALTDEGQKLVVPCLSQLPSFV